MIQRAHDVIERIAVGEMGLSVYPNQIEVITSEQMLDAYAATGMPIYYSHWSFGKSLCKAKALIARAIQALHMKSSSIRARASPTLWRGTR